MQRRNVIKLAVSSAAMLVLSNQKSRSDASTSNVAKITVDWSKSNARTTPFTFGSNDYEILDPQKATDTVYQSRLSELGIGLIRIHHADLSNRWANKASKTWDKAKIKAGYSASYPQKPTIIQNISGWPEWMGQNKYGLLNPEFSDRYAAFCGELVKIITRDLELENVIYWEPFNEKENRYQKAGKLDELWNIYNKVATAMKAVNPNIKVGGPVLNWNDPNKLADFLRTCKENVDFISWHSYGTGNAKESTNNLMSNTPRYGNSVRELRKVVQQYIPDRKVPLLLGEYNINYAWDSGENRQNNHIGAVWFASVLKHLADAGIDMATSWHLKDGIYGMIDPSNNLRPAANVFSWGIKYLTGSVVETKSDNPFVEAMAVSQANNSRNLLLINKSDDATQILINTKENLSNSQSIPILYLDSEGVKESTISLTELLAKPLSLPAYSLALLRF